MECPAEFTGVDAGVSAGTHHDTTGHTTTHRRDQAYKPSRLDQQGVTNVLATILAAIGGEITLTDAEVQAMGGAALQFETDPAARQTTLRLVPAPGRRYGYAESEETRGGELVQVVRVGPAEWQRVRLRGPERRLSMPMGQLLVVDYYTDGWGARYATTDVEVAGAESVQLAVRAAGGT